MAQLVLAPFQALLFSLRSCLCKCWLTPGRMGGRIPRLVLATMGWYNPLVLEQVHPHPRHVQGGSLQSHGHLVYEKINFENGTTSKDKIKLPFFVFDFVFS